MWPYDDARAAVRDVLRLSRAMTYKAAVAGLPLGGGKGVIMLRPDEPVLTPRAPRTRCCATSATRSRRSAARTSPPRTSARPSPTWRSSPAHRRTSPGSRRPRRLRRPEPVDRARRARSRSASPASAPSAPPSLSGRTVAVIGLGHVGGRLAELLREGGAQLVVTDVDPRQARARRAARRDLDRAAPRAHRRGRRLRALRVGRRARRRHGPAAALQGDRRRGEQPARRRRIVAELLPSAGILWAPDFVANAGGIINISVELEAARLRRRAARTPRARHRRHAAAHLRRRGGSRDPLRHRAARPRAAARRGGDDRAGETTGRSPARAAATAALDALRQAPLLVELAEVRARRHRREAQLGRRVVPDASRAARPSPRRPAPSAATSAPRARGDGRGSESSCAAGSMHRRAVARAQDAEIERAQALERREVAAQRARIRRDEHAALGQHGVAGEADVAGDEREVVVAWPGVATTVNGPNMSPSHAASPNAPRPPAPPGRSTTASIASAWSPWSCVDRDPARPAARAASATTAATCASSAGPGSTIQPGRGRPPTCSCRSA